MGLFLDFLFCCNDLRPCFCASIMYFNYTCFFNLHPKFKAKWAYKCYPDITHKFKIKGIYKEKLEDFDTNKYIIVIEDTVTMQIYLIGEKGVLCPVENKF